MAYEKKNRFSSLVDYLIDITSFNNDTRKALDALNKTIEHPAKLVKRLHSHPGGYIRDLYKRRISIAEAYIKIAHELESDRYEERLDALQMLTQLSLHAKNIAMPLNTARVQIALMKEAIKSRGNSRRQLETLSDFTIASFGHGPVIRKLLKDMNMIEVPEEGKPLSELDLGWDNHVHDSMSEGRKTPSQVLLDAFVKGISRLTIVYYNLSEPMTIREAIGAGKILGIDVNIGIELSVGKSRSRRHYTYLPGHFDTAEDFFGFFKKNSAALEAFMEGLKKNAENRKTVINTIIKHFNDTHLIRLNHGYENHPELCLKPLKLDDLNKFVTGGQYSRIHLGELLYTRLLEANFKRVLYLRTQYQVAKAKNAFGQMSKWELDQITSQYETVRRYYEEVSPERLNEKFLEDRAITDYDSEFVEEENIFPQLLSAGGQIKFIHPLEVGFKNAITTIVKNHLFIKRVETFNNTDSARRNPNELILFNRFVEVINNKPYAELVKFLEEWKVTDISEEVVIKAHRHFQEKPLIPECGSDSTGRDPKIPGMGFIKSRSVPLSLRKWYMNTHAIIPSPISSLILGDGKHVPEDEWQKLREDERNILLMGKRSARRKNTVGDENEAESISVARYLKYLNPAIKNLFRFSIGFIPAYLTFYMMFESKKMGLTFAALWFTITFFRNIIVDLVAAHGLDVKEWSLGDINFENAFQSLFWTGWSVPILDQVKHGFDLTWANAGLAAGMMMEVVKFFFICIANGTYIYTHNTIRNFDARVKRANFFRSVLAWPFATMTSPIGAMMGIPSIVQAKVWSDIIASVIEGTGKFTQRIVIRKRDLNEILPEILKEDRRTKTVAALDVLYIWAHQQRGNTCLEQILLNKTAFYKTIFRKTETIECSEEKVRTSRLYFRALFEFFSEEGCSIALSTFVIENYTGREAEILTYIIGSHFEQFKEWLYAIKRELDSADREKPAAEGDGAQAA